MQSDTCMHDANLMLLQQCIQTAKGSAATPRQGVALPGLESKSLTELLGRAALLLIGPEALHVPRVLLPAWPTVDAAQ
jgi:hypothetical protein